MEYGIAFPSYIDACREVQQFVTEDNLARLLTGSGPEIIEKLVKLEVTGVDHVAITVTDAQGARDLIKDFGREVIAKRT